MFLFRLSLIRGGGTTPLAAGVSVGHGLSIGENGTPTADSTSDGTWEYTLDPSDNLYYLTLKSGIWDFSNDPEIRCNVDINQGAVLKDGTINATVKNYGTIEGGTIRLCNNYGTIVNGTFDNPNGMYCIWNYNLISGGVFEQGIQACAENGMASKITDGTFKGGFYTSGSGEGTTVEGGTFASPPTNATGKRYSVSIGSWSGKCNIAINSVDFGENQSVYVVGQDYNDVKSTATAFDTYVDADTNKTKKFKEWQISPTGATLNAVDGGTADLTQKEIEFFMPDSYKEITLAAKYETVTTPTYDENLVIGTDGKPVTENRKPYGDGVQGDGWEYNTKTDTLTILTGHTESFTGMGVNKKLKVNVVVQKGAAVESGRFYKTVENHGTMSQALFCGNVTNTGDGTMKKCTFWDFDFTGNLTITITNEGEMEECIVMNDVTMLTNKGTMIRSSVGAKTVLGNGTYDTCLLAKNYGIAGTHKVTTKNETDKIMVRLVNDDGIQYYAEVEETEVYFTGTPRLKVQIGRYDDRWIRIPLTNVNGDENYGFTLSRDNFYIFAVPAEGDVILNDTVKHTLSLTNAEVVGMTGTEFTENTTIKIKPKFDDEELELDCWTSETTGFDVSSIQDNKDGTYTLKMPGNALTLTANGQKKTYSLTVENGVIGDENGTETSGKYAKDAEITLTQKVPEDKVFTGWELSDGLEPVSGDELTNTTIKVTMPGHAATATAIYKDKAPTTYTLTVDGGYIGDNETKTSGEFEANAEIKVTAKAKTGYHFTKWTVEEGTLNLSEEELEANPLTFKMPDGALSLKANYEEDTPDPVDPNPTPNPDDQPKTYTVTVKGGKINNKTEEKAQKGTELTVDVDETEVPEGMTFDVWSISFPKGVEDTLTGDPSVKLHDPHMTFTMPEADITIEAQYRSSELPGEDDGPSALGTMATVAVGGAAAGILVWQGVSLGVDSYLQLNLPKGVAVPTNRRELVVLLWETAGKPEAALPRLYSDVPAEEIELQKATRWAIDNGLVKPADDSDASRFDPDRYVTKYDVFGAWLKLKKLMKL